MAKRTRVVPPFAYPQPEYDPNCRTLQRGRSCLRFGLTVASVAMCRALLDHILTKHYEIRGMDLKDIISIAEERHEHLKGLNLQDKRLLGNTVLHKYEKRSTDLDKSVKDFLLTVRHLVTHIPRRDRVRRR